MVGLLPQFGSFAAMLYITILGALFLSSCIKKVPLPDAAKGPPAPKHQLEKTYGEVSVGQEGSLLIRYKEMVILINPAKDENQTFASLVDYLILTTADHKQISQLKNGYRKNIKIISPKSGLTSLQKLGFQNLKTLSTGQRIMLKKNQGFTFISATAGQKGSTPINHTLLEFDNGRNLIIGHSIDDMSPLRELVYSLRDDGKEIHLGIVNGKDPVEWVTLLQPMISKQVFIPYLTGQEKPGPGIIHKTLEERLYSGSFSVAKPAERIPF